MITARTPDTARASTIGISIATRITNSTASHNRGGRRRSAERCAAHITHSYPMGGGFMPATAPKTTPASRRVASGTVLSEPQRHALADLLVVLNDSWDDLPAETRSAYRTVIGRLSE